MTQRKTFLTPQFHGARFDGHAMPVSVLTELAAYERLVIDLAKVLFRTDHPDRKRVPKGFEQKLELVVRKIDEGSAVPIVEREVQAGEQLPLQVSGGDYFERARDLIAELVESASVPPQIPHDYLRNFNGFGRSLKRDEWIGLRSPNRASVPRYDRNTRKRIILLAESSYEDDCEITGEIVQFDAERHNFTIVHEGKRLQGTFRSEHASVVRDVAGRPGVLVRVRGTGRYDASDNIAAITEVGEIVLADESDLSIRSRLAELAKMPAGWFDGEGEVISDIGALHVGRLLDELVQCGSVGAPYLYPTPTGGIQAEWSFPDAEVSVEFMPGFSAAEAFGTVIRNQAAREVTFDLNSDDAVDKLESFISSFAPGFDS